MPDQGAPDRNLATARPQRPNWATPIIEEFDIADTVKGPAGTESDSVGGLIPAAS